MLIDNSAERSEAEGEQSSRAQRSGAEGPDCRPKPALPEGNSAGRLEQRQRVENARRFKTLDE